MKEIGLILIRICGGHEMKVSTFIFIDACVVTGGYIVAVELNGSIDQKSKFHKRIAIDAGRWRATGGIGLDKRIDNFFGENFLRIDHIMADVEIGADFAGPFDIFQ